MQANLEEAGLLRWRWRCPAKVIRWSNVCFRLDQRRRRWANLKQTLDQRLAFAGVLLDVGWVGDLFTVLSDLGLCCALLLTDLHGVIWLFWIVILNCCPYSNRWVRTTHLDACGLVFDKNIVRWNVSAVANQTNVTNYKTALVHAIVIELFIFILHNYQNNRSKSGR